MRRKIYGEAEGEPSWPRRLCVSTVRPRAPEGCARTWTRLPRQDSLTYRSGVSSAPVSGLGPVKAPRGPIRTLDRKSDPAGARDVLRRQLVAISQIAAL
jgi:hypothetical protein